MYNVNNVDVFIEVYSGLWCGIYIVGAGLYNSSVLIEEKCCQHCKENTLKIYIPCSFREFSYAHSCNGKTLYLLVNDTEFW